MSEETSTLCDSTDAFAKMWADFASRVAAAGLSFSPTASPPEAAGQVRDSVFRAAEQCWIEFLRSPQFLEAMKQTMDGAIAFRKQCNEWLTRLHHETQGAAREDIDTVMLCVRHLETRMLDRMEEIAARLDRMTERLDALNGHRPKAAPPEAAGKEGPRPEHARRKNRKK